ncbi:MAG: hypothetical protein JW841_16430 [Deltaproteobacteria bacterium]|nr:hypothetical protein [Deltaproteobacteria bacterium]
MITLSLIISLLSSYDYCKWHEAPNQRPLITVEDYGGQWRINRNYHRLWAMCMLQCGAKAPILRVTAYDDNKKQIILEKAIDLKQSLDPHSYASVSETFYPCDNSPPNRRNKDAVLFGAVSRRQWHNPRKIVVEIIAKGIMAPIAAKTQAEVMCQACETKHGTASLNHYISEKDTARFYISVPKARYQCAGDGGRLILRRYWIDEGSEKWFPIVPYQAVNNLQNKLKPQGDKMMYEIKSPAKNFCRSKKTNIWEVIGIDEYATIANHGNYGPAANIRRDQVEFLRCK